MNDLTEEWVIKSESDYRVAMREAQVTEQLSHEAASVLVNQASQPPRILKVFKWNAWPAESTFRREELYLDECR